MIASFASWVTLLWGWRRRGVATAAGLITVLGFPPFSFPLVLFVTFPVLVWLLDGALEGDGETARVRRLRPAFAVGWFFGFGFFLGGLFWIGEAFLVDAAAHGWMMPFAVAAMAGGMAIFYGVACSIARLMWTEGAGRVAALALAFGVVELARGFVLTGFPWNTLGYSLTAYTVTMQSAALVGVYGLTVFAVLIFGAPATLADAQPSKGFIALNGALLLAIFGYGAWRLTIDIPASDDEPLRIRIVQANIAQDQKWLPENRASIFSTYLDLSRGSTRETNSIGDVGDAPPPPDIILWPESAPPFLLDREPGALQAIGDLLQPGQHLITGANRVEGAIVGDDYTLFNSLYLISDFGEILDRYDKVRLVPFGEKVPFEDTLKRVGITRLVSIPGTFDAGRSPKLLADSRVPPFRALICYEIIFSGTLLSGLERPDWIVNVTNDAWFGTSIGPPQHLHKARVRAVELGLPVIRAANTGISAIITANGELSQSIEVNQRGVLDGSIPDILPETTYSKVGLIILIPIYIYTLLIWLVDVRRSSRRQMR
ncbi:MAG: apolipoprotein N-acyltransferase [Pseudomonadota bacterium]